MEGNLNRKQKWKAAHNSNSKQSKTKVPLRHTTINEAKEIPVEKPQKTLVLRKGLALARENTQRKNQKSITKEFKGANNYGRNRKHAEKQSLERHEEMQRPRPQAVKVQENVMGEVKRTARQNLSTEDIPNQSNDGHIVAKRTFNKQQYRLQKYSKKYKMEQWESKRKLAVIRNYRKELRKDGTDGRKRNDNANAKDSTAAVSEERHSTFDPREGYENSREDALPNRDAWKDGKNENPAYKETIGTTRYAKKDYKVSLEQRKEDMLKGEIERKRAMKLYKQRKAEKYKILSQKTKKGQPVMKGRIEMLLEKIQNS